eukprot:scaffold267878_cov17-Tisochrysis_lutea.AAC.1
MAREPTRAGARPEARAVLISSRSVKASGGETSSGVGVGASGTGGRGGEAGVGAAVDSVAPAGAGVLASCVLATR